MLSENGLAKSTASRWQQLAAIPEAQRVDEVKSIRDKAQALAAYARQVTIIMLVLADDPPLLIRSGSEIGAVADSAVSSTTGASAGGDVGVGSAV